MYAQSTPPSLDKMNSSTDNLVMLYAGGLHYNRWKVLSKIANALKCINESNPIKCQLKIYSSQNISDKIINQIIIKNLTSRNTQTTSITILKITNSC